MQMPHKITETRYDGEGWSESTSQRDYTEYLISAEEQPESSGYEGARLRHLSVYEDERTGILTTDVWKFEQWMEEVQR